VGLGELPEEPPGGGVARLEFVDFIRGRNEGLRQCDDLGMSPGELPVFNAVESGHTTGMAIHHPQQNRPVLHPRFVNRFSKIRSPRNLAPTGLGREQDRFADFHKVRFAELGRGRDLFAGKTNGQAGQQKRGSYQGGADWMTHKLI
jgi:hypothetical protein